MNFKILADVPGQSAGDLRWRPGIANVPGKGHVAGNIVGRETNLSLHDGTLEGDFYAGGFGPAFDPPPPETILSQKPLYYLIRIIDQRRLQMCVRAHPEDEWYLTPVYTCPKPIQGIGEYAFSTLLAKGAADKGGEGGKLFICPDMKTPFTKKEENHEHSILFTP